MAKLFCIVILICITIRSNAQESTSQDLSDLMSSLQKNPHDTIRAEILVAVARYYYFERSKSPESLDSMFRYIKEAEQLCNTIPALYWQQPEVFCFLGKYYHKTGNPQLATSYDEKMMSSMESITSLEERLIYWDALGFNIKSGDTVGFTRIDCLKKMLSIHRRLNNKEHEIGVEKLIADTYLKQGKLDGAENALKDVLAKYKGINYKNLHHTYYLLSVTNKLKGNYDKALEYGLLAIESMQKTNDYGSAINFYSNLAHLYDDLGQTDKSIEYYPSIFKLAPPKPINYYYTREAGFFVRALIQQNRKDEAGSFLLDFAKKYPPVDNLGKASLARSLAFYYTSISNHQLADRHTQQMIKLEPLLGKNNEIRRDVEYDIGQYYFGKKQFLKAATHFGIALEEAVHNNVANSIKDIHLSLFKTDSSLGDYTSAINHLNQFRILDDSIFNETKNKQLEEVQAKYDIKLLEKENSLQQNKLAQASNTRNWILGGAALLLVIVVLLIRNIRLKQRTNKKQKMQQLEIENQNGELRNLINEKDWLVKEIHHRVKNNLQIVMSLLNSQSAYIDNEPALTAIHESQHRVHAMSLIHQKLYGSENVSSIDMSIYIRELVSYLSDSFNTGQRIRFELNVESLELDVSQAVPLGLILNEAITNSIKYAFPDDMEGVITISLLNTGPHNYLLTISDNGIGMPVHVKDKKPGSLGMSLMAGLTEDLDGNFSIENKNGTMIKISFVHDMSVKRTESLVSSFVTTN